MYNNTQNDFAQLEKSQKSIADDRVILLFATLHKAGYIIRLKPDKNRVLRIVERVGVSA